MEQPTYLYHYTKIEALALILSNHTIRFNSLDHMDDLQEQKAADIKDMGKFCYISSWTDDETESIPMWNMYSSLEAGVRIKMPVYPFKEHDTVLKQDQIDNHIIVDPAPDGSSPKTFIPLQDMFDKKYMTPSPLDKNILYKVEYTSDTNKLYPQILSPKNDGYINMNYGDMGRYKIKYWEFQKEWRYKFFLFPINLNQPAQSVALESSNIMNKIILGICTPAFPYYDLEIDATAFKQMEITLSPRISPANRIIAETLLEKYNPTAAIKPSVLTGLL